MLRIPVPVRSKQVIADTGQLENKQAHREGGQKGSLSGDSGGLGFRIVRFRMQNSLAQTTACGRDDVFFLFRAEIRTSVDAMTLFRSSLVQDVGAEI